MSIETSRIILASRPEKGDLTNCFKMEKVELTDLAVGEIRVLNKFVSIDPYLRLRLNNAKSYMPPIALNGLIECPSVGTVIESNNPEFGSGDNVVGLGGWQSIYQGVPTSFRKIDTEFNSLSAHIGPLGMTGITAWIGVNKIIKPQAKELIVVNAASGAVGSIAGQLCKRSGSTVIGVAGSRQKCQHVKNDLGFDECISYKSETFEQELDSVIQGRGIDALFENVGGFQLDTFMERMNPHARVTLCGLISGGYNSHPLPIANSNCFLTSRITMTGFIVTDYMSDWEQATSELSQKLLNKQLIWKETIIEGLENAPTALSKQLKGEKIGKLVVRI